MTIDLSPEAARIVRRAVKAGDFPDAKAVVEAVVRDWNGQREELLGYTMEELRRLGDEGEASGPGREIATEEIIREGFRRAGVPYPPA